MDYAAHPQAWLEPLSLLHSRVFTYHGQILLLHACSSSATPNLTDHCGAIQRLIQSQYCLAWPSGTVAPSSLWIIVYHNHSSSTTAGAAASDHSLIYV